jgi:hypothetical protein
MKTMIAAGLAAALMAAGAFAGDFKSGLQPGDFVGAFDVEKCGGAVNDGREVGDNFCYRCMLGDRPVVMVFARQADPQLARLVKELDKTVAAHADQKLSSFVNLIGKDDKVLKAKAKKFAADNQVANVALVVPQENENGPEEFKISPDAEVTVILYRGMTVAANHAVAPGKLDKQAIDGILADTSKILK